jgi:hypothetical protein
MGVRIAKRYVSLMKTGVIKWLTQY